MIGYFASLVALIVTACIGQQFVPALEGLYEARVLLVPLVFLCSAVTISPRAMVPLAFIAGLLWDAQHYSPPMEPDKVYPEPVESLRFGYSVVLYGAMGFFMQGIQPLFREGKWHVSALLSGAAVFLYLSAEYLLITFVRGDIIITQGLILKIAITSLLTMVFSPVVFWVLFHLAALFKYTIRYEGFRKYRRQMREQLQTP